MNFFTSLINYKFCFSLIDIIEKSDKAVFAGHGRDVTDVDCTGDSEKFISSSFDKAVFLWDVPNTTVLRRFRGHAGRVNCVKLNEEGTIAVSGSVDGTARIWDLRSRSYEPIQGL